MAPTGQLVGNSPKISGIAYNAGMREGFGFIIFFGIIFIGWLMWSSEGQKQTFLGVTWGLMIFGGVIYYGAKLLF